MTKQIPMLNQMTYFSMPKLYIWCTHHLHKQQQTFHSGYALSSGEKKINVSENHGKIMQIKYATGILFNVLEQIIGINIRSFI